MALCARRKYSVFNVISGYEGNTSVQLTAKYAGGNYEVDLDPFLSFSNTVALISP